MLGLLLGCGIINELHVILWIFQELLVDVGLQLC